MSPSVKPETVVSFEDGAKCCREIGGFDSWHECGRPAVVFSDRSLSSGGQYRLFYCKRHERFANRAEMPSIRVERVGRVLPLRNRKES